MQGVRLFMFVVAIPALVALGHDIYLFVVNYGLDSLPDSLIANEKGAGTHFASLGFIWTEYAPESYAFVVRSVAPESWAIIDSLLTIKAFVAGLLFAGFFYFILGILRVLHLWPFAESGGRVYSSGRATDSGFKKSRSSGQLKYKRK
ncbi:MAG: hypothetical protein KDJ75_02910 [Alphaproteobacteria bacterium]|nr:hypothetical protein [Alphaproteobacteria bacterium]